MGKSATRVNSELGKWESLARDYLDNQHMWLLDALREEQGKKQRSRRDPERQRKRNLLAVKRLLDDPTPSAPSRLARWEEIGRAVLEDIERNDPGWCDTGAEKVNEVRELLKLHPVVPYHIKVKIAHKRNFSLDSKDILITIKDMKGKVLFEDIPSFDVEEE